MPKVQKTRNNGTMTEAQYHAKIRSALRRAFQWWEPMKLALKMAQRKSQSSNKRLKFEYKCAECEDWFARKEVHIDHIEGCGSLNSIYDIPLFIQRLTVEDPKAYQILCKKCHQNKTNEERKQRVADRSISEGAGNILVHE